MTKSDDEDESCLKCVEDSTITQPVLQPDASTIPRFALAKLQTAGKSIVNRRPNREYHESRRTLTSLDDNFFV